MQRGSISTGYWWILTNTSVSIHLGGYWLDTEHAKKIADTDVDTGVGTNVDTDV